MAKKRKSQAPKTPKTRKSKSTSANGSHTPYSNRLAPESEALSPSGLQTIPPGTAPTSPRRSGPVQARSQPLPEPRLGALSLILRWPVATKTTALLCLSIFVYGAAIIYAIFTYYNCLETAIRPRLGDDLFREPSLLASWILFMRPPKERDGSDLGWRYSMHVAWYYYPLIIIQIALLYVTSKRYHTPVRICVSLTFLLTVFGPVCTGLLLLVFGLSVLLSRLRISSILYMVNFVIIYVVVHHGGSLAMLPLPRPQYWVLTMFKVTLNLSCLRAISLGLALMQGDTGFSSALCYFLYLPCLPVGPLTTCRSFVRQLESSPLQPWRQCLRDGLVAVIQIAAWFCVIEVMDHVLFAGAAMFDIKYINFASPVQYVGLALATMLRFYFKCLIYLGSAEMAGRLEGIWLPGKPQCPLGITSSKQMWRNFDRGLYLWLMEHLYQPLGSGLLAQIISFAFVLNWHADTISHQFWAIATGCLIAVEHVIAPRVRPHVWKIVQVSVHWFLLKANMLYVSSALDVGKDNAQHLIADPYKVICLVVVSLCACFIDRYYNEIQKRQSIAGTIQESCNEETGSSSSLPRSLGDQ